MRLQVGDLREQKAHGQQFLLSPRGHLGGGLVIQRKGQLRTVRAPVGGQGALLAGAGPNQRGLQALRFGRPAPVVAQGGFSFRQQLAAKCRKNRLYFLDNARSCKIYALARSRGLLRPCLDFPGTAPLAQDLVALAQSSGCIRARRAENRVSRETPTSPGNSCGTGHPPGPAGGCPDAGPPPEVARHVRTGFRPCGGCSAECDRVRSSRSPGGSEFPASRTVPLTVSVRAPFRSRASRRRLRKLRPRLRKSTVSRILVLPAPL